MCGICFFWEDGGREWTTGGSSHVLGPASAGGFVGSLPSSCRTQLCQSSVTLGTSELFLASPPPGHGLGANSTVAHLLYTLLPSAGNWL